ncbi:MAG: M48 family metalloprotease [Pseudomonadota bacterium]
MHLSRLSSRGPSRLPVVLFSALTLVSVHALSGCGAAQVISGAQRINISEAEVQAEGRETHQEIVRNKLIYTDERINAYVSRVGTRVAAAAQSRNGGANAQLIFRFFVLDDPDTNAFAVPGGYVYVTRGLLAMLNSEDELASVLAHEVAHITDGHSVKASQAAARANVVSGLGTMGLTVLSVITFNPLLMGLATTSETATAFGSAIYENGYSRDIELTADRIGRSYSTLAGYDRSAGTRVLLSFQQEAKWGEKQAEVRGIKPQAVWGVLADHPENKTRIDALATSPNLPGTLRPAEADYLSSIDGLVFGISDRIGVQRGNTFYSQAHDLSLAVPPGWFVAQAPNEQSVMFFSEKNTARVVLISQDLSTRADAKGFAEQFFTGSQLAGVTRSTAGQQVWRGTVISKSMLGGGATYQAMTWTQSERGFALVGVRDAKSPLSETAWLKSFDKVAGSFKPLRGDEKVLAQSIKVRLAVPTKKKPLDYRSLALNAPLGSEAEDVLRVINGQYGSKAKPLSGQRLKVLR